MLTQRYLASFMVAVLTGVLAFTFVSPDAVSAAPDDTTPVGSWFGIARPCTTNPAFTGLVPIPHPAVDQEICALACGGGICPQANFPVPELTMTVSMLADGTLLADDFASVGVSPGSAQSASFGEVRIEGDGHTTAHGVWEEDGRERIGDRNTDRYKASFITFRGRFTGEPFNASSPVGFFRGSERPRFVTFFDKKEPDEMKGFIQPYLYPYTDSNGIVKLQPDNIRPTPDPVAPLPEACDPADFDAVPYCFGTLQFTFRRIRAY